MKPIFNQTKLQQFITTVLTNEENNENPAKIIKPKKIQNLLTISQLKKTIAQTTNLFCKKFSKICVCKRMCLYWESVIYLSQSNAQIIHLYNLKSSIWIILNWTSSKIWVTQYLIPVFLIRFSYGYYKYHKNVNTLKYTKYTQMYYVQNSSNVKICEIYLNALCVKFQQRNQEYVQYEYQGNPHQAILTFKWVTIVQAKYWLFQI
eukprot:TRINITY_DN6902_c0_g2_i1.p1 TRINITY_DN6902_c0_g2~~TRINITY_DN6902_c0_g2_i1.p1  ORF type:complete len:205 (+),score=-17.98 TRINITY_DN6902_c0_g2_i1:22-636(+)